MTKDGVTSAGPAEDSESSYAACSECFWHKGAGHFAITAKQARSAARYHARSTGHRSYAVVSWRLNFQKVSDGSNT